MVKLKSTQYFLLLISSLILSIIYLNLLLKYYVNRLELTSSQTGAISAIPHTAAPQLYILIITLTAMIATYLLWVWTKASDLKK